MNKQLDAFVRAIRKANGCIVPDESKIQMDCHGMLLCVNIDDVIEISGCLDTNR